MKTSNYPKEVVTETITVSDNKILPVLRSYLHSNQTSMLWPLFCYYMEIIHFDKINFNTLKLYFNVKMFVCLSCGVSINPKEQTTLEILQCKAVL